MKNIIRESRSEFFYSLTGAIQIGSSFLITPITTRILSPEDFGTITFIGTCSSLLAILFTFGSPISLTKDFFSNDYSKDDIKDRALYLSIIYFMSAFLISFFYSLSPIIVSILSISFTYSIYVIILTILRAQLFHIKFFVLSSLIVTFPIIITLVIIKLNTKLDTIFIFMSINLIFSFFILIFNSKKYFYKYKLFHFLSFKEFRVSFSFLPFLIINFLILNIDKIIIGFSDSKAQVGEIQTISLVGLLPIMTFNALNNAWLIWLLSKLNEGHSFDFNLIRILIIKQMGIILIFFISFLFFGNYIINILNPNLNENYDLKYFLLLYLPASLLHGLYLMITAKLIWKNKSRQLTYWTVGGVLMQGLVIFIMLPKIGIFAAPIGLTSFYFYFFSGVLIRSIYNYPPLDRLINYTKSFKRVRF